MHPPEAPPCPHCELTKFQSLLVMGLGIIIAAIVFFCLIDDMPRELIWLAVGVVAAQLIALVYIVEKF